MREMKGQGTRLSMDTHLFGEPEGPPRVSGVAGVTTVLMLRRMFLEPGRVGSPVRLS